MSLLKVTCRSLFMHTGLFWRAIALLYRFLLQVAFAGLFSYVQVSFYIYWSLLTGNSSLCERSPASTSVLQVFFHICRSLFIHTGHFWQAIALFCERSPASASLEPLEVSFRLHCPKSQLLFEKTIWRFFDSACTTNQKSRGANWFTPLFSNICVVRIDCLLNSFLSGSL